MYNSVRDCARHMKIDREDHYEAMIRLMDYCVSTPERGLLLAPKGNWDGRDASYEFEISVSADSGYAKDLDSRRSITGVVTYLDGAPVLYRSSTQKMVSLSTTEAEMNAVVTGVQVALFVRSIVESLGLNVKLPMKVHNDNHGEIDLMKSIGGRTRHIEVKQNFL